MKRGTSQISVYYTKKQENNCVVVVIFVGNRTSWSRFKNSANKHTSMKIVFYFSWLRESINEIGYFIPHYLIYVARARDIQIHRSKASQQCQNIVHNFRWRSHRPPYSLLETYNTTANDRALLTRRAPAVHRQ